MQALNSNDTIGQLAAHHPLAVRVLQRRGIDICCGGGKTLKAACQARGLDERQLLAEIAAEEARSLPSQVRWDERGPDELINYLLERYHQPLTRELTRLEQMAHKIHREHGDKDPKRLRQLAETVSALREELDAHMLKEERVLFPMILSGEGLSAFIPIHMMRSEHDSAHQHLARIRELTDNYTLPPKACATWRALWDGLMALEADLHEHTHLENDILFPRALSGN